MPDLSKFLRGATKSAFGKKSGRLAQLMSEWPHIVGQEMASYTAPSNLTFGNDKGTLHLRVMPHMQTEVEYQVDVIKERIATYMGFALVHSVRIKPMVAKQKESSYRPEQVQPSKARSVSVEGIADEKLKQALEKLEEKI